MIDRYIREAEGRLYSANIPFGHVAARRRWHDYEAIDPQVEES